eukprot:CFRG8309T1
MTEKLDLKVILLGSSGAGKTSLLTRYMEGNFTDNPSTIGASFRLKTWKNYKFGLWDTAGQERYASLSSYYCRGVGAAILVYDVADTSSFEALDTYLSLLREVEPNCYCILVGTKCDLLPQDDQIKLDALMRASQQCLFLYTAASSNRLASNISDNKSVSESMAVNSSGGHRKQSTSGDEWEMVDSDVPMDIGTTEPKIETLPNTVENENVCKRENACMSESEDDSPEVTIASHEPSTIIQSDTLSHALESECVCVSEGGSLEATIEVQEPGMTVQSNSKMLNLAAKGTPVPKPVGKRRSKPKRRPKLAHTIIHPQSPVNASMPTGVSSKPDSRMPTSEQIPMNASADPNKSPKDAVQGLVDAVIEKVEERSSTTKSSISMIVQTDIHMRAHILPQAIKYTSVDAQAHGLCSDDDNVEDETILSTSNDVVKTENVTEIQTDSINETHTDTESSGAESMSSHDHDSEEYSALPTRAWHGPPVHSGLLFAKREGMDFVYVSAKSGLNVTSIFDRIGYKCLETKRIQEMLTMPNYMQQPTTVNLEAMMNENKHAHKSRCC